MAHFVVQKFAYLRTPNYSATYHNDAGGSFSNSGHVPSLKAIAKHIWNNYRNEVDANRGMRVIIESWHGFDQNDKPVTTSEFTDVDALLARTGVTRGL